MPSLPRILVGCLRRQAGFTLIELMVAIFLTATAIAAVVGTLNTSRALNSSSERKEAAAHVGEKAMEEALSLPYASVKLRTAPGTSADETHPWRYVTAGPPVAYQWDQRTNVVPVPASDAVVVDATGTCNPAAVPPTCLDATSNWSAGRLSGQVHRFVTCVKDGVAACTDPSSYDLKRVTVAVTVNNNPRPTRPLLLATIVSP